MLKIKKRWNLFRILAGIISSVMIVVVAWQLTPVIDKSATFLLFILLVTANVWIGGLNIGLFITAFSASAIAYVYFFLSQTTTTPNRLYVIGETILFIITSTFICLVIEKYKRSDIEQKYRQVTSDFHQKVKLLESEKAKIYEEIKQRDEFLAIASHELRSPLTSMLLKLHMMLHNIRNVSLANFSVENLLKMLQTAEQQSNRLAQMINDLLNISLITTGRFHLELKKEDLVAIVKEVIDEFKEKLEAHNYQLNIETDDKIVTIIDKLRISQVITNLLSNAIQYGNSKPIDIKVTAHKSTATIIVKDHGIGITGSQKDHIFTLFKRGENNYHKGLGVGLYIVHQIVVAHHGTIRVNSKPKMGTQFRIDIPLSQTLIPYQQPIQVSGK